jgi:hypothetical protein
MQADNKILSAARFAEQLNAIYRGGVSEELMNSSGTTYPGQDHCRAFDHF